MKRTLYRVKTTPKEERDHKRLRVGRTKRMMISVSEDLPNNRSPGIGLVTRPFDSEIVGTRFTSPFLVPPSTRLDWTWSTLTGPVRDRLSCLGLSCRSLVPRGRGIVQGRTSPMSLVTPFVHHFLVTDTWFVFTQFFR